MTPELSETNASKELMPRTVSIVTLLTMLATEAQRCVWDCFFVHVLQRLELLKQ